MTPLGPPSARQPGTPCPPGAEEIGPSAASSRGVGRSAAGTTEEVPGLAARKLAADIVENVIRRHRPLDEQLQHLSARADFTRLPERDRALVRALAATVLRRLGTARHLLRHLLDRGLPADAPRVEVGLLVGLAQVLWLDVPDHAAVDLSVRLVRADRRAARYAGLVNAVLRRLTREGAQYVAAIDLATVNTPKWLMDRWIRNYGAETARTIATAHAREPALDLTVKAEARHWAEKLGGRVQDAAAALPARLMGELRGRAVADLCAAPGGKTMQLAAAGARVSAVDRSAHRMARLRDNLLRVGLSAELITADVLEWQGGSFDAVLLDAPCSATGTIRRHPDIPWIKREADVAALVTVQRRMITKAAELVKPGGTLIYCVCSLEPEEGIEIVGDLLRQEPRIRRRPIAPGEVHIPAEWLSAEGDLRTLPCHLPDPDTAMAGLDGFYAARLERE